MILSVSVALCVTSCHVIFRWCFTVYPCSNGPLLGEKRWKRIDLISHGCEVTTTNRQEARRRIGLRFADDTGHIELMFYRSIDMDDVVPYIRAHECVSGRSIPLRLCLVL